MKDSTKTVIRYLQSVKGTNVTAAEVAAATGLDKKSVDGAFTMAIVKKSLGVRTPAQKLTDDGTYVDVKYLSLTDAGYDLDLDAE